MAKVTGIGGVFLKCRGDSAALAAWYQTHLGLPLETWGGAILRWPDDKAEDQGLTVWSLADKDSQWFSPSDSAFMINYRVDDMDALLAQLRAASIEIVGGPDEGQAIGMTRHDAFPRLECPFRLLECGVVHPEPA